MPSPANEDELDLTPIDDLVKALHRRYQNICLIAFEPEPTEDGLGLHSYFTSHTATNPRSLTMETLSLLNAAQSDLIERLSSMEDDFPPAEEGEVPRSE